MSFQSFNQSLMNTPQRSKTLKGREESHKGAEPFDVYRRLKGNVIRSHLSHAGPSRRERKPLASDQSHMMKHLVYSSVDDLFILPAPFPFHSLAHRIVQTNASDMSTWNSFVGGSLTRNPTASSSVFGNGYEKSVGQNVLSLDSKKSLPKSYLYSINSKRPRSWNLLKIERFNYNHHQQLVEEIIFIVTTIFPLLGKWREGKRIKHSDFDLAQRSRIVYLRSAINPTGFLA
ncbi:hypothetical protein CEXT_547191 [Caerostris extrusa]|uniref:Maturase K n=1 Tax=Caerostris extrusa TaxID=172846 RepID=A0AAV4VH73_CAEEX|nr:hypothetical protein CEXT_547191 [Caerostris extrusa]